MDSFATQLREERNEAIAQSKLAEQNVLQIIKQAKSIMTLTKNEQNIPKNDESKYLLMAFCIFI
jgi:hypothetical protein